MMALKALRLVLFLVWWDSAASSNAQFGQPSEYSTPNCRQYTLPGCPRDFNPVCGSDLSTYPNECTLCMKISCVDTEHLVWDLERRLWNMAESVLAAQLLELYLLLLTKGFLLSPAEKPDLANAP
ncbi:hypothetical protein E5288_WYG008400 [Bos mutus]|uniref:Serine protease inhibitor Kazal-type 1 n=1 Tax=Bos mutus TaxID=72004 RepID=A0A6B0RN78_9CETA|nr:hypothetical protein [Bos mutus]